MTKVDYILLIILERSYLVQIHFWKFVDVLFVHNIFVVIGSSEFEVH